MNIQTRAEAKRGCGYRVQGGLYMVGGKLAKPCGKLPHNLTVCPSCGQGYKPFRGWGWVDAVKLFADVECRRPFLECVCPLSTRELQARKTWRCGLIWIGEKHYPTADAFSAEAAAMGISRRIKAIPKDFVLGETWVLLAHRKAGIDAEGGDTDQPSGAIFAFFVPTAIEYVVKDDDDEEKLEALEKRGITLVRVKPLEAEPEAETAVA